VVLGVLTVVALAFVIYGAVLAFGPAAKYRGLKTHADVTIDETTRSYIENRLHTAQAALAAQQEKGEDIDLNLYLSIASDAFSWGDLVTAREALEGELRANPQEYGAWNSYGKVLEAMGDFDGARTAYEKAITLSGGQGPDGFYVSEATLLEEHFPDDVEYGGARPLVSHGWGL
jgi:tetratricopeptide (TPR) repeat protein